MTKAFRDRVEVHFVGDSIMIKATIFDAEEAKTVAETILKLGDLFNKREKDNGRDPNQD